MNKVDKKVTDLKDAVCRFVDEDMYILEKGMYGVLHESGGKPLITVNVEGEKIKDEALFALQGMVCKLNEGRVAGITSRRARQVCFEVEYLVSAIIDEGLPSVDAVIFPLVKGAKLVRVKSGNECELVYEVE